jgi:hypothetical protein
LLLVDNNLLEAFVTGVADVFVNRHDIPQILSQSV